MLYNNRQKLSFLWEVCDLIVYQRENSSKPYNCDITYYDDFSYIAHLHKDFELVYISEGTVRMTVENRECALHAGDLALILPSQIHRYESLGSSKAVVAVFAEEYVPEFCRAIAKKTATDNVFRMEDRDRELLLRKLASPNPSRLTLSAVLSLACASFLETAELIDSENEKKSNLLLHRILFYISEHYKEDITLDGMAKALGYESHYISRCFHTYLNKNFKQFVNEYRINYAKHLIASRSGNMSMTEIAFASGFQSVRNFNRVYKNIEGTEPRRHIH